MTTRRDQFQSYQFMIQRVIAALVVRETDPQQSPLRRGVGALFGGLMVAVLVAAGAGVYGLLTRVDGDSWRRPGSVVVEKENGATYIYLDGRLYPTLNYTSALLALGKPGAPVVRVSSKTLVGVPRAVPVGIPNAPDSLPGTDRLADLPWSVCSAPVPADSGQKAAAVTTLALSAEPSDTIGVGDDGLLVQDATLGMKYLVWHGRRHLIQGSRVVMPALFGAATPIPVGTAWLNALPGGEDFATLPVAGRGQPSGAVPGRHNGDLLVTRTGSGLQHYLVLSDGVAPITPVQHAILSGWHGQQTTEVLVSEMTSLPKSNQLPRNSAKSQPPATPPQLVNVDAGQQICAITRDPQESPEVVVGGSLDRAEQAVATGSVSADGLPLADRVLAPAGRVTVLKALDSPGSYGIVTDLGIRYPVPSAAVLDVLGYPAERAVEVPPRLLLLIPSGPSLDPRAAALPAAADAAG